VDADGTESVIDGGAGGVAVPADDLPPGGAIAPGEAAIRIDLEVLLSRMERDRAFNVPVRPGDMISIPPAGSVLVDGWVYKPGAYPITRNLTLSGAIAAAGGKMYPADASQATMRRVLRPGEERQYQLDLDAVAEGGETDVAILDGDVVYLPASGWRLIPWGLWMLVNSLLRFGASVPLV
jgi:hypothetical protein